MKVEKGGVQCNKYDGYCAKQWIIIWTFFSMVFFMKDDMNDKMFHGTSKTLIPFNGVLNWDGVLKLGGRLKGDHATHFWG